MKRQLQVQVPAPCHEDWNRMDPAAKGRFCASCSKQVVDFTLMTDTEIINQLQQAKGNTCGRFSNSQLNRALEQPAKRKSQYWRWLLTYISSMLVFRSDAQLKGGSKLKPATTLAPVETKGEVMTLGMIVAPRLIPHTINGSVVDESGQPIPGALVTIPGTGNKTLANEKGNFILRVPADKTICPLNISAIGYTDKQTTVYLKNGQPTNTRIQLTAELMGDIVVTSVKNRKLAISGKVLDEKTNKPIPYAAIYTGTDPIPKQADDAGRFAFTVTAPGNSLKLDIVALGFENEHGSISLDTDDEMEVLVTMKPTVHELPALTVVSYDHRTLGKVLLSDTKKTDTVAVKKAETPTPFAAIPEIPKTSLLNIYPNPALKGGMISILMPGKDQWQINLVDNNGALLKTSRTTVTQKNMVVVFLLPGQMASGMYYIQLVNSRGKSAHTGKLLVQ